MPPWPPGPKGADAPLTVVRVLGPRPPALTLAGVNRSLRLSGLPEYGLDFSPRGALLILFPDAPAVLVAALGTAVTVLRQVMT